MSSLANFLYLLLSVGGFFLVSSIIRAQLNTYRLRHIPTVGPSSFLKTSFGSAEFVNHAREIIQEGYDKSPSLNISFTLYLNTDSTLFMQTDYTMGKPIRINLYHFDVFKTTLTRNISARFSDVRDEIVAACAEEIPATEELELQTGFWLVFLCKLNIEFAGDVFKAAVIITLFPDFLPPIVGTIVSPLERTLRRAMGHLGPITQDRMNDYDQYDGDWPDKPNDLITWLLDENPQGEYLTFRDLIMRVLEINLAAIHPTSMLYTNSLFQLAIQPPEVVAALRGEIESDRYQDASNLKFKPSRFTDMRSKDGEGIKHHMFTPSPDYLSFGTGKHACCFLSVNSIKSLFSHTLLTSDVKLEGDKKEIPEPVWFGRDTGPNRTAKISFRNRKF
ncbi:cytochrome P450 [Dendrothele bispora CBS 962.96]|uniref:Cytochrome P450 n=1 Tax=Dendrothele bispora (strain CBS 962.96) TaxID=1314807 RepID=A0A4S8M109_DENBC|nr:cytochrome P450 [Dendrothele bispora CBS 962.96]